MIGLIWNHLIGQVRSNFNPLFVFKLKHCRYILSVYVLRLFCHIYKGCSPTSTLLNVRPRCQASFYRTNGILVSLNFDPTKALVEDEHDYKCLMI